MQFPLINVANQPQLLRMHFNTPRPLNVSMPNLVMKTLKQTISAPATRSASLNLVDTSVQLPKMEWGAAIWIFFHTLAFKVRETEFAKIKIQLINFIRGISSCLPCPKCTEHATKYLSTVNFNTIICKRDLILMLYAFHNTVNNRKHSPIMSTKDMDIKYATANTIAVVKYFVSVFCAKNGNMRIFTDAMQRQLITKKFETWFAENVNAFES